VTREHKETCAFVATVLSFAALPALWLGVSADGEPLWLVRFYDVVAGATAAFGIAIAFGIHGGAAMSAPDPALLARANRVADWAYTRDHGGKWERFRDFVAGVLAEQRAEDADRVVRLVRGCADTVIIPHAGTVTD
jgi:hypothetical protein